MKAIGAPVKFHAAASGPAPERESKHASGPAPERESKSAPRPAPVLGQHTREVLAEAGYAAGEIDAMIAEGAAVAG